MFQHKRQQTQHLSHMHYDLRKHFLLLYGTFAADSTNIHIVWIISGLINWKADITGTVSRSINNQRKFCINIYVF